MKALEFRRRRDFRSSRQRETEISKMTENAIINPMVIYFSEFYVTTNERRVYYLQQSSARKMVSSYKHWSKDFPPANPFFFSGKTLPPHSCTQYKSSNTLLYSSICVSVCLQLSDNPYSFTRDTIYIRPPPHVTIRGHIIRSSWLILGGWKKRKWALRIRNYTLDES